MGVVKNDKNRSNIHLQLFYFAQSERYICIILDSRKKHNSNKIKLWN